MPHITSISVLTQLNVKQLWRCTIT